MGESFLSEDPIEQYLGKRVEKMTEWELISYLQNALKALYDITLVSRGAPDRSIFSRLQREYGDADAGRIVKWTIWAYFGRDQGDFVQFSSFSKGRTWWVNHMHSEMQKQVLCETTPVVQSAATAAWI